MQLHGLTVQQYSLLRSLVEVELHLGFSCASEPGGESSSARQTALAHLRCVAHRQPLPCECPERLAVGLGGSGSLSPRLAAGKQDFLALGLFHTRLRRERGGFCSGTWQVWARGASHACIPHQRRARLQSKLGKCKLRRTRFVLPFLVLPGVAFFFLGESPRSILSLTWT